MLYLLFLSAADTVLLTADADVGETVPMLMLMERPLNQLSKILRSSEGVSVVTT
jgi:hypothetical protein